MAVAAVVAESRAVAEDAANAIEVEYEALPSVIDAEKALEPGAPLAREELDSNICYIATKKGGDVDKAFAQAEHICRMHIASPRQVALAIEPRGIVGEAGTDGRSHCMALHSERRTACAAIWPPRSDFPSTRFASSRPTSAAGSAARDRCTANMCWPVIWRSSWAGPIKWIATRSEDFVTTIQGRDQAMTSELALKKDGTMLGLESPRGRRTWAPICTPAPRVRRSA